MPFGAFWGFLLFLKSYHQKKKFKTGLITLYILLLINESLCYQWLLLQVLNHNVIVDIEVSFNVALSVKHSADEYHHIPQSREYFDATYMSSQKGVQSVLFNGECQKRFAIWQHNCLQKLKILFVYFISIFSVSQNLTVCRKLQLNFISEFFFLETILSSEMAVAAQHILYHRGDLSINFSSIEISTYLYSALSWTLRA